MLTIEQITRLIGVYSSGTIYRWYREGFLPSPAGRSGKANLWSYADILAFTKQKRIVHAYR